MKRMSIAILLISQLVACGGGGSHVDKIPLIEAGKLNGDINSNAQATVIQITPVAVGQNDIVDDAILTRLDVVLDPEATVGQVNTALDKLGAKIVSSRDTSLFLTISVPRQSDFSSLADLAKQLTAMPGIAFAIPGQQGSNRIYPHYADAFPSVSPDMTNVHLRNARLSTAWNAGGKLLDSCLNNPVSLLIVDKFGSLASLDPAMVDNINREFPSYTLAGSVLDDGETHGWDVAAIAAADFSPSNQTGAMPFSGCVNLTLLSVSGLTFQQQLDVIDTALRLNGGEKTIVNYSLGFKDRCDGTCTAESIADGSSRADFRQITPSYTRVLLAMSWRDMSHDLWGDFIITTAGGDEINEPTSNIYLNLGIMGFNSPINLASTGGTDLSSGAKNWGDGTGTQPGFDLIGTDDVIYQILQNVAAAIPNKDQIENNVIMVGNGNIFTDSIYNTDFGFDAVYALGENLLNLAGTNTVSGTSLSAPQVAGLAAYLWALDPSLKDRPMADTMHAILDNTTRPDSGADLPMLDAYATTLSLDKDTAASPPDAPIRGSILDVNDDGFFNQDDLTLFVNVYGLTTAPNPRTELIYFPDYDRFDLNGNWLFLKETGRFDLDPENSTYLGAANYSTVNLKIGTTDIPLDENNLTKTQILCYYAYSPLYLGDQASLDNLLPVDICGGKVNSGISKVFGTATVGASTRAFCSQSGGACAGKTKNSSLPQEQRQLLQVSGAFTLNTSWSDGQTSSADANITYSDSIDISPTNGNLLTYRFNTSQTISANTAYPSNPNDFSITSTAESDATFNRDAIFTLNTPATYTASVNISISPEDNGGFALRSLNTDIIRYTANTQFGNQIYTGVLSPGDYQMNAICITQINLKTTNKITPAGLSDTKSANCSVTLDIVPNN